MVEKMETMFGTLGGGREKKPNREEPFKRPVPTLT